jgi:hypothetical protein
MKSYKLILMVMIGLVLSFTGCSSDDNNGVQPQGEQFQSIDSPYLICATRNPGGVGFDFEYNGETGGPNHMDSLSVSDFEYDIKIRTIKAQNPDESLNGMPFIVLGSGVEAVDYSRYYPDCKGFTDFQNLTLSNVQSYTLGTDDPSFDLTSLTPGTTGKPLKSDVQAEYAKLVIGDKWKSPAKNDVAEDETVWIIKTGEGRLVKIIVTDFPADPAPTSTGYVEIEWDFLQ